MSEHYYTENPRSAHDERQIEVKALGRTLRFTTDAGVFSRDGLDRGTEVLLNALPELEGRVLDLGCGWGAVGVSLGAKDPGLEIVMTDLNARAVELARRNPKTKIVAAHGAGLFQNGNYPFFPNLDSLERETAKGLPKNLWVDTAHYLLYCYPTILQKMVDLAGADHVVYGTDAPLQGPMQMRFMAELVDSLDNPQSDKDKIFYRNAEKILGVKI